MPGVGVADRLGAQGPAHDHRPDGSGQRVGCLQQRSPGEGDPPDPAGWPFDLPFPFRRGGREQTRAQGDCLVHGGEQVRRLRVVLVGNVALLGHVAAVQMPAHRLGVHVLGQRPVLRDQIPGLNQLVALISPVAPGDGPSPLLPVGGNLQAGPEPVDHDPVTGVHVRPAPLPGEGGAAVPDRGVGDSPAGGLLMRPGHAGGIQVPILTQDRLSDRVGPLDALGLGVGPDLRHDVPVLDRPQVPVVSGMREAGGGVPVLADRQAPPHADAGIELAVVVDVGRVVHEGGPLHVAEVNLQVGDPRFVGLLVIAGPGAGPLSGPAAAKIESEAGGELRLDEGPVAVSDPVAGAARRGVLGRIIRVPGPDTEHPGVGPGAEGIPSLAQGSGDLGGVASAA